MANRDGTNAVDGGLVRHVPVLAPRVVDHLNVKADGVYVDATFGAGGYTRAILAAANCRVVGIDRDRSAIARGAGLVSEANGRLTLAEGRFSELEDLVRGLGVEAIDGIAFDLGVSSMQLDEAERGFSFRFEGPLDMRMGRDGPSVADLVAEASERDLASIITVLGEERFARLVARAIVKARAETPITTTKALADIVGSVVHARVGDIHPATRTFQALRIFINEELTEIAMALAAAERMLKPGGRLVVVSFHSLEDRIAKTFLVDRSKIGGFSRHQPEAEQPAPSFTVLTKRPEIADEGEVATNPRARSAKLRAAERTSAPAQVRDVHDLLPRLPSLDEVLQ